MADITVHHSKGDVRRLDRLYELRKWDPNKVSVEEAIRKAIAMAWYAAETANG